VPSIVGTWKLVRAVARDGSGATLVAGRLPKYSV
jgi:hypothetical protein